MTFRVGSRSGLGRVLALALALNVAGAGVAWSQADEDRQIADSLAAMLRAGRAVISGNQERINDPKLGSKGLDGATVLAKSIDIYQHTTGTDPRTVDPASRPGRLLNDEMQAIKEVMDANQASINAEGTGFKGFIPAVFSRLVSETFSRLANGEAEMRVTAPPDLVRNRKSRPDAWETETIKTKFLAPGWPAGQSVEERADQGGHTVFRIAVPEYYAASCLACHGSPKGQTDITGYPKEGAALGDLGGVISIKLMH
jgi:hypothetical protein